MDSAAQSQGTASAERWRALRLLSSNLYPHPALWGVVTGVLAVNALWLVLSPRLSLAGPSYGKMAAVALLLPLALAHREYRVVASDRLLDALSRLFLLGVFAGFMTQQVNLFSHLVMSLGMPLVDDRLSAWDHAIGFDWNGYANYMAAQPWSRWLLLTAYGSGTVGPALLAILAIAVWKGRHDRVNELAFLAVASGLICVGVAGLVPALSAWNTVAASEVKALVGPQPQIWLEQVQALRGGGPVSLDLSTLEGIATFPSYHTCLALIILWCSRGHWAGWGAGAAVGLAILAATPVYGGHYGVDLLAGGVVMLGLVLLWRRLAPARQLAGAGP